MLSSQSWYSTKSKFIVRLGTLRSFGLSSFTNSPFPITQSIRRCSECQSGSFCSGKVNHFYALMNILMLYLRKACHSNWAVEGPVTIVDNPFLTCSLSFIRMCKTIRQEKTERRAPWTLGWYELILGILCLNFDSTYGTKSSWQSPYKHVYQC